MTKKAQAQANAIKTMWNDAIREGRLVRVNGGERFIPCTTVHEAHVKLSVLQAAGYVAEIVSPSLAQ